MLKLFIIYGRNLSKERMNRCCPTANPIAVAALKDHQLVFQGHPHNARANVVPADGHEVPVVIWEISAEEERRLDAYKSISGGCFKKSVEIEVNGETREALIYVMEPGPYGTPSDRYLRDMAEGYREFNLPALALNEAVADAYENSVMNGAVIYAHENTVDRPAQ